MRESDLTTKKTVLLGLLVALHVALGLLSVQITPGLRVSVLGFLPIALAGMLMGPLYGAITGMAGDMVNYLLITNKYGPYFPGYTLTAFISGLWYGYVLFGKKPVWWRSLLAIGPVVLLCEMGLNSLWVYMTRGSAFWSDLPGRVVTNLIELPVKTLLLMGLSRLMKRLPQSYLNL